MKIILSCTTTYERRNFFYYGIQSLLRQSFTPDLFLVNISEDSYLNDSGFTDLPGWLKDDRITVNWVENTGPYRKLLPALDYAEDDDVIITVDDDVLYDREWLERLVRCAKLEPNSITCTCAKRITKNIFGRWKNYDHWILINSKDKGMDVVPVGIGGVAYRKRLLDLDFVTDKRFLEIAPTTDDLWFKEASRRKGAQVAVFPNARNGNISLKHQFGLHKLNFVRSDVQSNFFKLWLKIFKGVNDYLGIRKSKNDKNWSVITAYSDGLSE